MTLVRIGETGWSAGIVRDFSRRYRRGTTHPRFLRPRLLLRLRLRMGLVIVMPDEFTGAANDGLASRAVVHALCSRVGLRMHQGAVDESPASRQCGGCNGDAT